MRRMLAYALANLLAPHAKRGKSLRVEDFLPPHLTQLKTVDERMAELDEKDLTEALQEYERTDSGRRMAELSELLEPD